jgi:hypothetical protein
MRPTLIIAALIAASPALAARCPRGQFYRVRLDQCVSLSSPLARPYLGAWSSQKNRAEGETIDTANLGEEIETSPEDGPPATSDPLILIERATHGKSPREPLPFCWPARAVIARVQRLGRAKFSFVGKCYL